MGLDNGIVIKKPFKDLVFPSYCDIEPPYYREDATTICYWRKCWGIRDEIVQKLHVYDHSDGMNNDAEFELDEEDIVAIRRILRKYFSRDYYDENADSIWDFDEFMDNAWRNYENLIWLQEYKHNNPDVYIYFYDSY